MKITKTILNKLVKQALSIEVSQYAYTYYLGDLDISLSKMQVDKVDQFHADKIVDKVDTNVYSITADRIKYNFTDSTPSNKIIADLELSKLVPSASKDKSRPILECIDIEPSALVATDSYRLVSIKGDYSELPSGLYNAKMLELIAQVLPSDTDISVNKDVLVFGNIAVLRQVQGEYPNWEQLIPQGQGQKTILPQVKKIKHPLNTGGEPLTELSNNKVSTYCLVNKERRELHEPIAVKLELDAPIALNNQYYSEAMKTLDATRPVEIYATEPLKPIRLTQDNTTVLLMPVRTN